MDSLQTLLSQSADLHKHLCPRQVLGVRMGLFGGQLLGLSVPQPKKRILTIMETDGCGADGVSVATNCWVGRRTMRIEDYGKMAATFIDTRTEKAVRVFPQPACRETAVAYAPEAKNRWESYLLGYQRMPDTALLAYQLVTLKRPVSDIISRPGVRTLCAQCGEEIINQREIVHDGTTVCQACAHGAYYLIDHGRQPASPCPPQNDLPPDLT